MIELDDTATVADVIKLALRSSVDRLYAHEAAVRRARIEDLHQAAAARRMRSDLRTFHAFVGAQWANELRAELRWVGSELGEVRDIEVMLERLRRRRGCPTANTMQPIASFVACSPTGKPPVRA
jgi:CHAD domain-containing protein